MSPLRFIRRAMGYTARRMAASDTARQYPGEGATDVSVPPFVLEGDEERWENAGKVAAQVLQLPEEHEQVWSMRRVIFHDRVNYPS